MEVLRQCLSRIDDEVRLASEGGLPIWWPCSPPGTNQRVLALCVAEAVLLNSRDKVCAFGGGVGGS